MSKVYKYSKTIEPHEVDYKFDMSLASMIATFQALATYHAVDIGCDYQSMRDKAHAFWVVTRVKLHIDSYPRLSDTIDCATWYEEPSLIRCPRVYELSKGDSSCVKALSEWCAIDIDTYKPHKLDSVPFDINNYVEDKVDIVFDKNLYEVSDADFEFDRVIRYSDLDMNMHTNNVIYSKIIMDTFDTNYLSAHTLRDFQIDYVNQSKEGDTISVYQKQVSEGFFFIIGNVSDKCIFRAYVRFE